MSRQRLAPSASKSCRSKSGERRISLPPSSAQCPKRTHFTSLLDALVAANCTPIITLALGARLPTIFDTRDYVQAGGLMSYGPNFSDLFRRAAEFVDKILRGTKPADMPVEQPTKFELVINLKTAKALGLDASRIRCSPAPTR